MLALRASDAHLLLRSREAHHVVRLAADDPLVQVQAVVTRHQGAMLSAEEQAARESLAAYQRASSAFADHFEAVARTNPSAAFSDLLLRPDVASALSDLTETARQSARATLAGGHLVGYQMGLDHAAIEAHLLGLPAPSAVLTPTTPFLGALLSDFDAAATGLPTRLQSALHAASQLPDAVSYPQGGTATNVPMGSAAARAALLRRELDRAGRDMANRASAGSSSAVNRAYTDAQIASYRSIMADNPGRYELRKVWVTDLGGNPCALCAALHGTVLEVTTQFDSTQSFAAAPSKTPVYGDLQGPPRHPHCRCRIVLQLAESSSAQAVAMREAARSYAASAPGQAPRSFAAGPVSDVAKRTDYLTSEDVRRMSDSKYRAVVDAFRACLVRRFSR